MNRPTAALCAAFALSLAAHGQMLVDQSFTYQGRLTDAGAAPTGQYDLQITLWDHATGPAGGSQQGSSALDNVQVTGGLFTARLNFPNQFTSQKRWLQIAVRPGTSTGSYTTLLPRQEVTSAPWSNYALGPWETVTGVAYPGNGYYLRAGDGSYFGMDSDFGDLHVNGGTDGSFGITSDGIPSGSFNIATGGTTRFTIKNGTGHVGIGTTNPQYPLHVVPPTDTIGIFAFSNSSLYPAIEGDGALAGVRGTGSTYGVDGLSTSGIGVHGNAGGSTFSGFGDGVVGDATGGHGVKGTATSGRGVEGRASTGIGVTGDCTSAGTYGFLGDPSAGVYGNGGSSHFGVRGDGAGSGIGGAAMFAYNSNPGGIALVTSSSSGDANTVIINTGAGDLIRCFSGGGGGNQVFTVTNCGTAVCKVLQITGGCDLAELFAVARDDDQPLIIPGMVVVIDPDHPGALMLTDKPYDTRVAGILSGANGLAPGLVLKADDHPAVAGDHPLAMTGRVWCWVDAAFGEVKPGDSLTTSTIPGTAMRANDASRMAGASIGLSLIHI